MKFMAKNQCLKLIWSESSHDDFHRLCCLFPHLVGGDFCHVADWRQTAARRRRNAGRTSASAFGAKGFVDNINQRGDLADDLCTDKIRLDFFPRNGCGYVGAMSNYCLIAPDHPVHGSYHDTEYGFHATDERVLFERLALEIMQAGLSWEIVLKKRKALNRAFDRFVVTKVAAYGDTEINRLLADPAIIRNRMKINAIIHNAEQIIVLRKTHGGFLGWLEAHHPQPKAAWVKLFKKQFKFTGGEIVGEFLMSLGYLSGAHREDCSVYRQIIKQNPPWRRKNALSKP